eukprot:Hpha_TRINITY_DN12958_c0_g3::TRINITY_DN12958_c0_g3_i3::g.164242::m.164242
MNSAALPCGCCWCGAMTPWRVAFPALLGLLEPVDDLRVHRTPHGVESRLLRRENANPSAGEVQVRDITRVASMRQRFWPAMFVTADIPLIFGDRRLPPILIAVFLVYAAIERTEAFTRFGLYEVFGWDGETEACDCASPPCAEVATESMVTFAHICWMLLADFHITSGFEANLRQQLRQMRSAADVAAEIASALARYDVDAAEAAISKGFEHQLPYELAMSYKRWIANLTTRSVGREGL